MIPKRLFSKICSLQRRVQRRTNHFHLANIGAIPLRAFSIGCGCQLHVPVRTDGEGTLTIERSCNFGYWQAPRFGNGEVLLQPRLPISQLTIGQGTHISNNVTVIAMSSITIGANCLVGDRATIIDSDFHGIEPAQRHTQGVAQPVTISDNAWIGSQATILKGVTIGENSVIAAQSVVTTNVPPNCIAAGSPAKVVRTFFK
ncbi:acyltransferase [Rosistilla oblonga]|uniref:acyltransferase n=1 Tax=Rosistilla oblonga TaxID=2527990 RepID=UPI003A96B15A